MRLIEFCVNNLTPEVQEIKERLEEDPELDVIDYDCTTNCTICAEQPFALVDGELIVGESAEELLDNIYQALEGDGFDLYDL